MDYNDFWEMQQCLCCIKEEMEQIYAPFVAANDVTGSQLRILMVLRHSDGQTVSALARVMCMADANMSTQVKRLQEKGLVQRRRHEDDERQVRVSLTDAGVRIARAFVDYCNRRLRAAMEMASAEEREAIRKGLSVLERVVRRREGTLHPTQTAAQPLVQKSLHVRVYKENRE